MPDEPSSRRRGLIGGGGSAAAGLAGAAASAGCRGRRRAGRRGADAGAADAGTATYPFHGAHQAGIVTPAQDRLHFAAFDVTTAPATSWSRC